MPPLPSHLTMAQFGRLHDAAHYVVRRWVNRRAVPSEEVLGVVMIPSDAPAPPHAPPLTDEQKASRLIEMQAMRSARKSLAQIADSFGISRQRAAQILQANLRTSHTKKRKS